MKNAICCFTKECFDCKTVLKRKVKSVITKPTGEPVYHEQKKAFRKMQVDECSNCGSDDITPIYHYNEIFESVSFNS